MMRGAFATYEQSSELVTVDSQKVAALGRPVVLSLTPGGFAGLEVMEAGLATHYVASERLPQLVNALHALGPRARDPEEVRNALQSFQVLFEPE